MIDLSKQKNEFKKSRRSNSEDQEESDSEDREESNLKNQQINFIVKLEQNATIFFIIEEANHTN